MSFDHYSWGAEDPDGRLSPESGYRKPKYSPPKQKKELGPDFYAYFETRDWHEKNSLILRYFKHKCVVIPSNYAMYVHHITYTRFKRELPQDLIPLSREVLSRIRALKHGNTREKTERIIGPRFLSNYIAQMKALTWATIRTEVNLANQPKTPIVYEKGIIPKPSKQWF